MRGGTRGRCSWPGKARKNSAEVKQVESCTWGRFDSADGGRGNGRGGCKCGKGTKLSLKSYIAWVTEFIFLVHVDSELSPHARLVWTVPSSACS